MHLVGFYFTLPTLMMNGQTQIKLTNVYKKYLHEGGGGGGGGGGEEGGGEEEGGEEEEEEEDTLQFKHLFRNSQYMSGSSRASKHCTESRVWRMVL